MSPYIQEQEYCEQGGGTMGLGAGIVGMVTVLLLSGLGHFLSQGPSFLIYKHLKV